MPAQRKPSLGTDRKQIPADLRSKYRKLAIPAVVAAMIADKKRPELKGKTTERRRSEAASEES
jgi:hypothetical protein